MSFELPGNPPNQLRYSPEHGPIHIFHLFPYPRSIHTSRNAILSDSAPGAGQIYVAAFLNGSQIHTYCNPSSGPWLYTMFRSDAWLSPHKSLAQGHSGQAQAAGYPAGGMGQTVPISLWSSHSNCIHDLLMPPPSALPRWPSSPEMASSYAPSPNHHTVFL